MNILFTGSADLLRLNPEATNGSRERYKPVFQGLKVNIQPADYEYVVTQDPTGALGKIFKVFTTYSGCQIGMVLVSSGTATVSGMRMDITGVEPWYGPLGRHYELLVRKSTN